MSTLALAAVLLAGCNSLTTIEKDSGPDVLAKVRAMDLSARFPRSMASADANSGNSPDPQIYPGKVVPVVAQTQAHHDASGAGYDLNFERTPITTVAKTILGDILGLGYTIDPRVQGTITLASGRPVPKSQVLYVLEAALRLNNVALIRQTGGYRLVPLGDAVGNGRVDPVDSAKPGYGISVVPLRYVSASTVVKLLDSFATKPGTVRVDPESNLVLIQGTGSERKQAIQTVLSFDTDWMRGQSVGIYPVRNSVPEQIIADLQKIMDSGEGGLAQGLIKFQAIDRMNAVMAVTRQRHLLKTVSVWIQRLDRSDTTGTGVHVYHVRYGDAGQIARVLNRLFVGNGANNLESSSNQIAPGSGVVNTSSADGAPGMPATAAATGGFGHVKSATRTLGQMAASIRKAAEQGGGSGSGNVAGAEASGPPILKNVRITADTVTNSLLIYASQENYRLIERTLRQVDRPQLQVAINATIAEVTLNKELDYGVQFYLTSHNLGFTNSYQDASSLNVSGVVGPVLSQAFPGFNFLVGNEAQPQVILDALHDVTTVKVLSNPSIVVMDNEPAVLQVGDEIPVSTGTATVLSSSNTVVNTIDYRNTGVILQVVPRINVNGNVVLSIQQEISNVSNPSGASTLTPTVSQRKIKSTIAVASGQTVLLAGLIGQSENHDHPTIPGVAGIPLLNDVLGHNATTSQRTELIIFIRPEIIRDSVDAQFVAEELRSKLTGTSEAMDSRVPGFR